ncbi:MAG: enamine deaminase RidA (YjgF/YER057c/UK114 family) [Verrucomicrobiales bacterium]|jgi:enamine deaminase RidA (YjgF/YER057c/UK114 family)
MTNNPQQTIQQLGLTLPESVPLGGLYKRLVISGTQGYLSGHGPYLGGDKYITGRLGEDMDVEAGQAAARQTGLALLRTMQDELGDLSRVARIIKALALVNSTADFVQQPQVINGFSELMRDVFGAENGIGARSAIGTNTLPGNIAVEIELIIEIKD